MAYHWNQDTGRFEDENGNPTTGAVPMDQMQGAGGPAPGALAANARAGADLSQPVAFDKPAVTAPLPSPTVMPLVTPTTSPMPMPPEVQKTGQHTTYTREKPTAEEGAALGALSGDFNRSAATARQEGDLLKRQTDIAGAGENVAAAQAASRAAAIADEQNQRNVAIAAAQARVEQDRQKFEAERQKLAGMDVKDMYEGRPGLLIANALAIALGQFGAALSGTSNGAATIIAGKEQQWYANQRARIEKQKEAVGTAREAIGLSEQQVQGARQEKADAIADLNLSAAARADALAAKIRAMSSQIGTEHASLMGEKLAQAEEQKRDSFLLQYQTGLRTKVATEISSSTGPGAGNKANALVIRDINGNPIPLVGNPQAPAVARDAKSADEIDTMRAGTMDLVSSVQRLKQLSQQGVMGRTSANLSGDAEGLRKDTTMHYLRATVGRINEQELKNSDQTIPSIGYVNAVRDPARVYDEFLRRSVTRTTNELVSKTNLSHQQAQQVVDQWYKAAGYSGGQVGQGSSGGPDAAKVQMARQRLKANPNDQVAKDWLAAHGL